MGLGFFFTIGFFEIGKVRWSYSAVGTKGFCNKYYCRKRDVYMSQVVLIKLPSSAAFVFGRSTCCCPEEAGGLNISAKACGTLMCKQNVYYYCATAAILLNDIVTIE